MRVSRYIGGLVVVCFMAGSVLACEIVWRHHVVEQLAVAGRHSAAAAGRAQSLVRDVDRYLASVSSVRDTTSSNVKAGPIRAARLSRGRVLAREIRAMTTSSRTVSLSKQLLPVARTLTELGGDRPPDLLRAAIRNELNAATLKLDARASGLARATVLARGRALDWIIGASSLYILGLCVSWWLSLQFFLAPLRDFGQALRRHVGERLTGDPACEGASESQELVRAVAGYTSQLADELDEVEQDAQTQIDELARVNLAKSEFLASMSHEIRTPMTAILGYADLLDRTPIDPQDRKECLEVIARNGAQLLEVINDILDISKIEAGKMTLERVPSGSTATIAEVVTQLRHKAEAKNVRLETIYRDAVPDKIDTDPTRYRQVVANVLSNAIALCSSDGEIRIEIGIVADAAPSLELAISPSCVDLTRDELEAMFDPFTQADCASTPAGAARLGLAIARRLTELLGGELRLSVDSEHACTLCVLIPIDLGNGDVLVQGPPDFVDILSLDLDLDGDVDLSGVRVLLVEDGIDNQELISMHVRDANAEVRIACTAEEALLEIQRSVDECAVYDVVLMDMFLPGMNGSEAIRILRAGGDEIAVVMLTASDNACERDECLSAGADDFVTKPVDRRTLVEAIEAQLKKNDMPSRVSNLDSTSAV